MSVQFDSQRIVIFGQGLLYDPYYFVLAGEDTRTDYNSVVRAVLGQWAEAIAQLGSAGDIVFLPFGVYDQCTECLEAKALAERVILRCVWLDIEGWQIDLHNLTDFMKQSHNIVTEAPEKFGVFNKLELIAALRESGAT